MSGERTWKRGVTLRGRRLGVQRALPFIATRAAGGDGVASGSTESPLECSKARRNRNVLPVCLRPRLGRGHRWTDGAVAGSRTRSSANVPTRTPPADLDFPSLTQETFPLHAGPVPHRPHAPQRQTEQVPYRVAVRPSRGPAPAPLLPAGWPRRHTGSACPQGRCAPALGGNTCMELIPNKAHSASNSVFLSSNPDTFRVFLP